MEYYNLLNFNKEPFSNSPEPEFLFHSPQYNTCLQMLELAVRLKRGLNVVIGDIGTGKTTLCRKLIQSFAGTSSSTQDVETYLLLDPSVKTQLEFLKTVAFILGINNLDPEDTEWHLKEKIKTFLFNKGVNEDKIIVLIIDEGQKIPSDCLEILREFLNYETNNFKLLQIVIFAQEELKASLKARPNLLDRVNILYYLKPLNFRQMKAMIEHRVSVARQFEISKHPLVSVGGLIAIYLATGGYPRKVVSLCHQIMLKMIIRGRNKATWFLVRSYIGEMEKPLFRKIKWALTSLVALSVSGALITFFMYKHPEANAYKQANPFSSSISANELMLLLTQNNDEQNNKNNLGALTIKKGITLWWVVKNIYGEADNEIIEKFMKANPRIKNIDQVFLGEIVNLPIIPALNKPLKENDYLVAIENGKDLDELYYNFLEYKYQRDIPEIDFFAFQKNNVAHFAIVLDQCFNNALEAQEAIRKLPPQIAAKTQILSNWGADTVFLNRKVLQR